MVKTKSQEFLAVHPEWATDLMWISSHNEEAITLTQKALAEYKGPAAIIAGSFDPNDVYQISEREYYSFGDGVRYMLADNGSRIALVYMKGMLLAGNGGSHYEMMADIIQAAEHPAYAGVLMVADSPGGTTRKMDALYNAVANYSKPIGVWVSGNLNSAAAYVTANANFILADPNEKNSFGSIGVFTIMENLAKKLEAEGHEVKVIRSEHADKKYKPNAYEPWTDEEMATVQAKINEQGEKFINAMASGRSIAPDTMAKVKTGEEFDTDTALAYNLLDGTATMEEAINKVATKPIFI
jgi:signal peptide peptidase SppA